MGISSSYRIQSLPLAVEGIAMYAVYAYVEVYFTRWPFRSSMSAAA
jgi:NitT/TauT family transport system permease protein